MSLDLPQNSKVFIDTNIFVYHLLNHPRYAAASSQFLERIEEGMYSGCINQIVLSETLHICLRARIAKKYSLKSEDFLTFIKEKQDNIAEIDLTDVEMLLGMENIKTITDSPKDVASIMKRYQLLSSDAIIAIHCRLSGIENIATNDADFERVDFLKVWKP